MYLKEKGIPTSLNHTGLSNIVHYPIQNLPGHPVMHTVRNLHFFVQKINFDFPRKLSIFWGGKTRENVVILDFLAVDNFDFTRKIVDFNFG